MGRYIVRIAEKYFDMDDCDARGYPKEKYRYTGEEYETNSEPEDSLSCSVASDGYTEIHTVISGGSVCAEEKGNERVGYIDCNSSNVQLETVMELKKGHKVVRTYAKGAMGVVNRNNQIILPLAYRKIQPWGDNGLLKASSHIRDGKEYIFRGSQQLACYDRIYDLKDGLAKVYNAFGYYHGYGYIDSNAKRVIETKYYELSDFNDEGYAIAKPKEYDWHTIKIDRNGVVFTEKGAEECIEESDIPVGRTRRGKRSEKRRKK